MLIISLGNGRCQVQQCRPTSHTDRNGFVQTLCHAQGVEARRALVGNGEALNIRALVQVMDNSAIARTGADHRMANTMSHEQGSQYVYMLFITVHDDEISIG